LKILRYVLEDFLEEKAMLTPVKTIPLQRFLFSQPLDGFEPSAVDGLRLGSNLILISEARLEAVENVIFVRPRRGGMRIRQLHRKGKDGGEKGPARE